MYNPMSKNDPPIKTYKAHMRNAAEKPDHNPAPANLADLYDKAVTELSALIKGIQHSMDTQGMLANQA